MTDEQNSGVDDYRMALQDALTLIEDIRQDFLNSLREIEILSQAMLQREVKRLSRKLGADHPRVQNLETQLNNKLTLIKVLEAELELAKFRVPEVDPDAWVVQGKVVDEESKQGMGKVIVSLYDKDLFFDDVLGTTITDDEGKFEITYRTEAFRDLFEAKPDLYVKVLDATGKTLYCSRKPLRPEASHIETFNIAISGETDDSDADD